MLERDQADLGEQWVGMPEPELRNPMTIRWRAERVPSFHEALGDLGARGVIRRGVLIVLRW
jgi:hypothetical protein